MPLLKVQEPGASKAAIAAVSRGNRLVDRIRTFFDMRHSAGLLKATQSWLSDLRYCSHRRDLPQYPFSKSVKWNSVTPTLFSLLLYPPHFLIVPGTQPVAWE